MKNAIKLNDETIGQIAKLIQVAILTGTDIVDNLRTLELAVENNQVFLTPEYRDGFEKNIECMMEELEKNTTKPQEEIQQEFTFSQ